MSQLLNSKEALKMLGLGKNHRYLKYLNDRNLLPRVVLGPRTFRYEIEDCQNLVKRAKTEGLLLTVKP
jgi:hypothetical protein